MKIVLLTKQKLSKKFCIYLKKVLNIYFYIVFYFYNMDKDQNDLNSIEEYKNSDNYDYKLNHNYILYFRNILYNPFNFDYKNIFCDKNI